MFIIETSAIYSIFTVYSPLHCATSAEKLNFYQMYSGISALPLDDWFELYV